MSLVPHVPAPEAPLEGARLIDAILNGTESARRRALSAALTLLESTRPSDRAQQESLAKAALPFVGTAFRLGITGARGSGKSTLVNLLGLHLVEQGFRVAVLVVGNALEPGVGAVLSDKVRMAELATSPDAFIRPSPAGTTPRAWWLTREAILLCEAAGFDIVILETTTDQPDTHITHLTDMLIQLHVATPTSANDESAGARVADLNLLSKADSHASDAPRADVSVAALAERRARLGEHGTPASAPLMSFTALGTQAATDVNVLWDTICEFRRALHASGQLEARRGDQQEMWLWERIGEGLMQRFRHHPTVALELPQVLAGVRSGARSVSDAARSLLDASAGPR